MRTLAQRLLIAGRGGGFTVPGGEVSPDETAFWQDMAALLDPDAYEYVLGGTESRTVDAGETWYLVSGWWIEGGTHHWFHRHADHREALPLSEGTTLELTNPIGGGANPHMVLCKPSLVTGGDARYSTDPRALYFDRLRKVGELEQFTVSAATTGSGLASTSFPTDFDNGLVIHVSTHDVSWTILGDSADTGGMILQDEISDATRVRFAYTVVIPFVRTTFPKLRLRGASQAEGRSVIRYLKLPEGW